MLGSSPDAIGNTLLITLSSHDSSPTFNNIPSLCDAQIVDNVYTSVRLGMAAVRSLIVTPPAGSFDLEYEPKSVFPASERISTVPNHHCIVNRRSPGIMAMENIHRAILDIIHRVLLSEGMIYSRY